jgi:hypothetical protein
MPAGRKRWCFPEGRPLFNYSQSSLTVKILNEWQSSLLELENNEE